jgi:hypothetical protein
MDPLANERETGLDPSTAKMQSERIKNFKTLKFGA